jgi:spore coat protein A, manganese oxidase
MYPQNVKDLKDSGTLSVDPSNPLSIPKYVDPLPVPSVLPPKYADEEGSYYEITMKKIKQKLHSDFQETTLFAYEGLYPGPTIEASRNVPVRVKWINKLPVCQHLLPVDTTLHGAEPDEPRVRTVVHLHGGEVPPESDGYPEAWFTNNFGQTGTFFTTKVYYYPNEQRATTLWYHDHALGITRLNVYAGLAGFYILRDRFENSLNLPRGNFEIPIVIQDRSFNSDASLFYPSQPENPTERTPNPSIVPEFFGNTILVNGKVWPFLEVEPRKYRFRLLNGSNSRFYNLKFDHPVSWVQIGNEGGFLENPVPLTELLLAPAERADVIIDFSRLRGQSIIMTNDANSPFPIGDLADPNTTGQIMEFRVTLPLSRRDTSEIPDKLPPIEKLNPAVARKTRDLTLDESTDKFDRLILLLTGRRWDKQISEKPCFKSIETWRLINLTPDTHPIHLHLVHFQVLHRRPFDVGHYMQADELIFTGPPVPPDPNESGWKDTVRAEVGMVTSIIAKFDGFTGIYPWHCHILEHEDHEMMRPYEVIKKPCK